GAGQTGGTGRRGHAGPGLRPHGPAAGGGLYRGSPVRPPGRSRFRGRIAALSAHRTARSGGRAHALPGRRRRQHPVPAVLKYAEYREGIVMTSNFVFHEAFDSTRTADRHSAPNLAQAQAEALVSLLLGHSLSLTNTYAFDSRGV